jgi:hypothetical protein
MHSVEEIFKLSCPLARLSQFPHFAAAQMVCSELCQQRGEPQATFQRVAVDRWPLNHLDKTDRVRIRCQRYENQGVLDVQGARTHLVRRYHFRFTAPNCLDQKSTVVVTEAGVSQDTDVDLSLKGQGIGSVHQPNGRAHCGQCIDQMVNEYACDMTERDIGFHQSGKRC